ncbi:MAG: hypothetical protein AB7O59_12725 [Pirellulales bacterium]
MSGEVWLRTNKRALWLGVVPLVAVALAGAALAMFAPAGPPWGWLRGAGIAVALFFALLAAAYFAGFRRPRLAYDSGRLLVGMRLGSAVAVPIEVVECFFLGQAPSLLPGSRYRDSKTKTIIVRLAEAATDWHRRPVEPRLGSWCDGYITIRGTACEPLSLELVNRLNSRLAELSRAGTQ